MIRVIYRWRVKPGGEEDFRRAWEKGTRAIIGTVEGAHGSLLMRCKETPSEFVGIARWDSFEAWQSARQHRPWPPDSESTRTVRVLAGRTISTEIFEELSDLTIK
jgi:heme-degrading monooxygenase HmoA